MQRGVELRSPAARRPAARAPPAATAAAAAVASPAAQTGTAAGAARPPRGARGRPRRRACARAARAAARPRATMSRSRPSSSASVSVPLSHAIPSPVERAAQRAHGVVGARLDRALGNGEPRRDRALGEVVVVGQLEHLPVRGAQRLERRAHVHAREQRLVAVVVGEVLGQLGRRGRAAPVRVDGRPAGEREDPRRGAPAGGVEARRRAPQAHERVLDDVLGELRVAQRLQRDAGRPGWRSGRRAARARRPGPATPDAAAGPRRRRRCGRSRAADGCVRAIARIRFTRRRDGDARHGVAPREPAEALGARP